MQNILFNLILVLGYNAYTLVWSRFGTYFSTSAKSCPKMYNSSICSNNKIRRCLLDLPLRFPPFNDLRNSTLDLRTRPYAPKNQPLLHAPPQRRNALPIPAIRRHSKLQHARGLSIRHPSRCHQLTHSLHSLRRDLVTAIFGILATRWGNLGNEDMKCDRRASGEREDLEWEKVEGVIGEEGLNCIGEV